MILYPLGFFFGLHKTHVFILIHALMNWPKSFWSLYHFTSTWAPTQLSDLGPSIGLHPYLSFNSISSTRRGAKFQGTPRLWRLEHYSRDKKGHISTLVNYNSNCVLWALSSREGVRGKISILILDFFGYDTNDPVVQSIDLYSLNLVQFESNNCQVSFFTSKTSSYWASKWIFFSNLSVWIRITRHEP